MERKKGENGTRALSPSVRYMVSVLEERIRSGVYVHGRWLPSERALAEEFSVCRPTVRQAIVLLEQGSLIQRTAGHRPIVWNRAEAEPGSDEREKDGSARFGGTRAAQTVALWISGTPRDMGPIALTNGVHQGLAMLERPLRLVMSCPQGTEHPEVIRSEAAALRRLADDPDVAGVILWYLGGEENRAALDYLREAGKALVFVDREPPPGFEADFVGVHNILAAADAVRYLIGLGHSAIAHVTNADRASTVLERLQGYQEALRGAGIPFRPERVLQGPFKTARDDERQWREIAHQLFAMPEPPTAAFAVNDYTAHQLIRSVRAIGKHVPEDLAVVGFDNSERWSVVDPFMTSVSQPFEQIGNEAARLLQIRLAWPQVRTFRYVLLPAGLVVRASSGPSLVG